MKLIIEYNFEKMSIFKHILQYKYVYSYSYK